MHRPRREKNLGYNPPLELSELCHSNPLLNPKPYTKVSSAAQEQRQRWGGQCGDHPWAAWAKWRELQGLALGLS